jgi:hypothetical protein
MGQNESAPGSLGGFPAGLLQVMAALVTSGGTL